MKKEKLEIASTTSAQSGKPVEIDITKRVTHVDKYGRVSFNYPKHFTMAQRGKTQSRGLGRNMSSIKVPRIVSPYEQAAVKAAKKDIGHKTKKQYSNIAQRRVPRALHYMYGLPMRDTVRPASELPKFLKSLNK